LFSDPLRRNCPPADNASPLILHDLGRAAAPLDGLWQFHTGDDPAWASPALDDSTWSAIEAGQPWETQGYRNYTGFAWYRRRLILPADGPHDFNFALYLPSIDGACDIYWNGALVGSYGKLPPHPVWYGFGGFKPVAVRLGAAQSGVLALRVWSPPIVFLSAPDVGGLIFVPQIGSAEAIAGLENTARYRAREAGQFVLSVGRGFGLFGCLALLAWLRNPRQMLPLWLSLAMVYPAVRPLLISGPDMAPFRVGYGLIGPLITLNDLALWFLLIHLLGLASHKRLVRWAWIIGLVSLCLDLTDSACIFSDWSSWPPGRFLSIDVGTTVPVVCLEVWGLVIIFAAFGKRLDTRRWIVAFSDFTGLGARWTHSTLIQIVRIPIVALNGSPLDTEDAINLLLLVSILYAAWRYSIEQYRRQSSIALEMRNAREVQQVLIPDALPSVPGFAIESVYKPAGEVGGDFFQILPLDSGGVLAIVGDVSGKGMPAAMTVSLLVGAVGALADYTQSPGAILAAMNQRMLSRSAGGFTTCLVARVEPAGHLTIANAGHLAPYLDGEELALENGLPLGIAASATYRESTFSLRPNARLTLMTDGVVEARSGSGELFGFDRARHQPPLRRIDRRRSRAIRPGRRHHRPDLAACQINR
jgi:hypothetical protein